MQSRPTSYSSVLSKNTYKPVHTITIEKPTALASSEILSAGTSESPVVKPFPRVSDPSFRTEWNERNQNNTTTVSFELIPGVNTLEYLHAITSYMDPLHIESVGRDDGRQCVVFKTEEAANEAIMKGIQINGTFLLGIPVCIKPIRVILNQIPSFMPEEKILDYLKRFGKLVTWLRPIPINSNNMSKYQHILSFRREIFIQLFEGVELPNKFKINFNGVFHSIYIETEATCYKCKNKGHMTHSCPLLNPPLPLPSVTPIIPITPIQPIQTIQPTIIPSISSVPLIKSLQEQLKEQSKHVQPQHSSGRQAGFQEPSRETDKGEEQQQNPNESSTLHGCMEIVNEIPHDEIIVEHEQVTASTSTRKVLTLLTEENVKRLKTTATNDDEDESDRQSNLSDASLIEDTLDVDEHGIFKTTIPLKSLQSIIRATNYKKNLNVIRTKIEESTTNYDTLLDDLQTYRNFILQTSPKPQNICQRIDRLIPKIRDILSSKSTKSKLK